VVRRVEPEISAEVTALLNGCRGGASNGPFELSIACSSADRWPGGRVGAGWERKSDRGKMHACPPAVLDAEGAQVFRSMPGTVFHQRPAEVSIRQPPRLGEIAHPIAKVGAGLGQFCRGSLEPEPCGCLRSHLHQPDLADAADRRGIIPAFDPHYGVDEGRRHTVDCRLLSLNPLKRLTFWTLMLGQAA